MHGLQPNKYTSPSSPFSREGTNHNDDDKKQHQDPQHYAKDHSTGLRSIMFFNPYITYIAPALQESYTLCPLLVTSFAFVSPFTTPLLS